MDIDKFGVITAANATLMKEFKLKEGYILTDSAEEELLVDKFKIIVMPAWKWILQKQL